MGYGMSKDPRREKINELKSAIKQAREELSKYIEENPRIRGQEERNKKINTEINQRSVVIEGLVEELKITRMNKTGSKYFEYTPHRGLNKRQRNLLHARNNRANS